MDNEEKRRAELERRKNVARGRRADASQSAGSPVARSRAQLVPGEADVGSRLAAARGQAAQQKRQAAAVENQESSQPQTQRGFGGATYTGSRQASDQPLPTGRNRQNKSMVKKGWKLWRTMTCLGCLLWIAFWAFLLLVPILAVVSIF